MKGYSLILNDPERGPSRFDFPVQPEGATATRPAQTTAARLPDGSVYRSSFGQNIGQITLQGTFGFMSRQVGSESLNGFDLFLRLRRDFYDRYLSLTGSSDPRIRSACTMEIHQWQEDEHWFCEPMDFQTPRDTGNRVHYRYILVLRLLTKIQRVFPPPATDPLTLFRQVRADLLYLADKVGGVAQVIETTTSDASGALQRNLLSPFRDLLGQVERSVAAGLDFVNLPARSVIRMMETCDTALESLGRLVSSPIIEAGRTLLSIRRTLQRLAARPGLLRETFQGAVSGLVRSLAVSPNSDDSETRRQALMGGENASRSAKARSLLASSAAAVRQVTVRAGDTLALIAARELGSAERWMEIAALNGMAEASVASDSSRFPVGSRLLIPQDGGEGLAQDLGDPRATYDQAEAVRLYGRDFRLVERDGRMDLAVGTNGDPGRVEGEDCVLQGIRVAIRTRQGTLLEDPTWGFRSSFAERATRETAEAMKFSAEETAKSDTRVAEAKATVEVEGNVSRVDLQVTLSGSGRVRALRATL